MSFGTPPFSARFTGDGVAASMGVVGTQGTADVSSTASLLPFAVNPATGAQYVEILAQDQGGGGTNVIISGTNGTQTTAYPAFVDSNNAVYMNMLYVLDHLNDSITTYPLAYNYWNTTGTIAGTIKSAGGTLHTLIVNTPLAGGTINLFDGTISGTAIASIITPAALLTNGPITATYDVSFINALAIQVSGANQNITISYI